LELDNEGLEDLFGKGLSDKLGVFEIGYDDGTDIKVVACDAGSVGAL
jgi:hypothetical protein